ncbi:hypothetical protein [Celeribacter indicus]|uniref:Glycoprotein endopeptidase YdiC n=1 Tax=Celeribacter indicus TaxID=1208324 RepID=A0A0B5DRQ1_9RHOB|nr:hypothetical protein [Celeribacter indicus]AJE46203.1 glycoprotein endopeptidase YdiC [Celeribacter indicus]SDW49889.1 tRNA threonylcarbamoyladenosine biosynthesis protein TsaB [Celeribacter indicus]
MSLVLLLQASNGVPSLGLGRDGSVVFDSARIPALDGSRDYRALLDTGLSACGATLPELTLIACDTGPGGLGVTRTAAAFANGLGFALGLPVLSIPAFEALGAELDDGTTPVALLRRAARPHVHFGLYRAGKLEHYEHCLEEKAREQLGKLDDYVLAGNVAVEGAPPPATNRASMATLLRLALTAPQPAPGARAHPIVEVLT